MVFENKGEFKLREDTYLQWKCMKCGRVYPFEIKRCPRCFKEPDEWADRSIKKQY